MRAKPGDWLVVETAGIGHDARRARIEEVGGVDGGPPYRVRWLDTGRVGLLFPGPDAHVVTGAELADHDAVVLARADAVRRVIARRGRT